MPKTKELGKNKTLIAVVFICIILIIYGGTCSKSKSDSKTTTTTGSSSGPAPTVTAINPTSGYNDLYTPIQITGTNFVSGATVKIGVTSALSVTFVSTTLITCTINYGLTSGVYTVTVTNPDTQSAALINSFTATSPPAEWSKETLTWDCPTISRALTSTCTILLPDGITYRMYFTGQGGIWTITSTNGTSFLGNPVLTGVDNLGATNPNVISLTNGTYLMIYGVQLPGPTEQLYRATSDDGITFIKQGVVLTADAGEDNFISVPDLIYISGTRLRMYFVASPINSRIHTAYSDNDGATWIREGRISITGGPIGGQECDPDIIKLQAGTYRLFFTTPPVGQSIGSLRMRSAVSTDGRNFTLESGSRVTPAGLVSVIMDPDVILIIGTTTYRVYYGANLSAGGPDDLRAIISP